MFKLRCLKWSVLSFSLALTTLTAAKAGSLTLVDGSVYTNVSISQYKGDSKTFVVSRGGKQVEIRASEIAAINFGDVPFELASPPLISGNKAEPASLFAPSKEPPAPFPPMQDLPGEGISVAGEGDAKTISGWSDQELFSNIGSSFESPESEGAARPAPYVARWKGEGAKKMSEAQPTASKEAAKTSARPPRKVTSPESSRSRSSIGRTASRSDRALSDSNREERGRVSEERDRDTTQSRSRSSRRSTRTRRFGNESGSTNDYRGYGDDPSGYSGASSSFQGY